jgi:hypothetical protein
MADASVWTTLRQSSLTRRPLESTEDPVAMTLEEDASRVVMEEATAEEEEVEDTVEDTVEEDSRAGTGIAGLLLLSVATTATTEEEDTKSTAETIVVVTTTATVVTAATAGTAGTTATVETAETAATVIDEGAGVRRGSVRAGTTLGVLGPRGERVPSVTTTRSPMETSPLPGNKSESTLLIAPAIPLLMREKIDRKEEESVQVEDWESTPYPVQVLECPSKIHTSESKCQLVASRSYKSRLAS